MKFINSIMIIPFLHGAGLMLNGLLSIGRDLISFEENILISPQSNIIGGVVLLILVFFVVNKKSVLSKKALSVIYIGLCVYTLVSAVFYNIKSFSLGTIFIPFVASLICYVTFSGIRKYNIQ